MTFKIASAGAKRLQLALAGLFVAGLTLAAQGEADLLANLKPQHPRLLINDSMWKEIQARRAQDDSLARLLAKLEADGRATLGQPPLQYQKQGKRLLNVSRAAVQRIARWSFDYRLTGDVRFRDRAEQEMLTVAAFPDWNPGHFLDVAEMTAAVSLGYDWLYDELPAASQLMLRQAIVEKGLRPGVDPKSKNNGWYHGQNNWNQVCFGGLTLGALAVADEEPELARQMLAQAKANIHNGLEPYMPDGVYPEGPGYWGYGTSYQVLMIAALESALGTDWGLAQSPGFSASAASIVQLTGPTGQFFNFSDGGATSEDELSPAQFWLAKKLGRPDLLWFQHAGLAQLQSASRPARSRFLPLTALWWPTNPWTASPALPLNWLGRGRNPIAVFRSSWTDSNALYLAIKGGTAANNHGHMDAGSFVLEADGVRWARDLGAQDYYSIESRGMNLWSMNQDSDRWKVFRLNNFSHSTLTIGGQLHQMKGFAPISRFSPEPEAPRATVDMTQIFAGQATRATREFQVHSNRMVLIQDDLAGLQPGETVRWAMVTSAKIEAAGNTAILTQNGKELSASISAPESAAFEVISADHTSDGYDAANPNTRILIFNATAPPTGNLHLCVHLQPEPPVARF